MMVTTPPPAAAAAAATPKPAPLPAPTGAPAASKLPAPTGDPAAGAPPAPTGAAQAAAGAKVDDATPPAAGDAAAKDAAAAKQAVLDKLDQTTAVDAIAQVESHLEKISGLSVGGATPEGAKGAQVASALLTDSSMLLQHAHVKAMEQIRTMATELHMRLMSSASGLAFMGGQVAIAGQSKEPVKLADIVAGPIKETKQAMADVVAVIAPPAKDAAGSKVGAAPAEPDTPAPAAPAPAGSEVTNAPNGNSGVVPSGLQHVTPGPGAGRGPNPA